MQNHSVNQFRHWVESHLNSSIKTENSVGNDTSGSLSRTECNQGHAVVLDDFSPLAGDAGHRQYFRATSCDGSWIAVRYPRRSQEEIERFVTLADFFRCRGVHTAGVVAADGELGYLLLEDLGVVHLLDQLSPETADSLYADAMMNMLCLQQFPAEEITPLKLPHYSRERLRMEMNLMCEWFVGPLLGHTLSAAEQRMLDESFAVLENSAAEQPQVLVHRDFHSRNLILRHAETMAVIDFQDAVIGPVSYDPVSLLRDCYIEWPEDKVAQWAECYRRLAEDAGILVDVDESTFFRWFDLMGLQRHIKVLGIFSRLSLRDNKHQYLQDLPLVVRYVRQISSQYSALTAFSDWFEQKLMPLVHQQEWYADEH